MSKTSLEFLLPSFGKEGISILVCFPIPSTKLRSSFWYLRSLQCLIYLLVSTYSSFCLNCQDVWLTILLVARCRAGAVGSYVLLLIKCLPSRIELWVRFFQSCAALGSPWIYLIMGFHSFKFKILKFSGLKFRGYSENNQ